MKKVCLDAGHDAGNKANASPDKTYYEHEFALDMAQRMKVILERHGVQVTMTRYGGEAVTLLRRCEIADAVEGLDLFVSLHSDAAGSTWSSASGWSIYTCAAGDTAERNKAANAILARVQEAGVTVRSSPLKHNAFFVLKNTNAPAVLIEHAFHSNHKDVELLKSSAHRDKLAEAQCKGILDYLGVAWQPETAEKEPWYAQAQKFAVEAGISDGTRPLDNITRAEVWEMLRRFKS